MTYIVNTHVQESMGLTFAVIRYMNMRLAIFVPKN